MLTAIAWLFLALVWGTTWAAVKVGLQTLPPMLFSGMRFALAGLILLLVAWVRGQLWPERQCWSLLMGTAALAVAIPYGLQFWGQQYIASGLAAVLTATIPVIVIFMAHWSLPDDRLSPRKLIGAALALAGIVAIFSDQLYSKGAMALAGSTALLVGAVSTARSQIWIKQHAQRLDPLTLAAWQMSLGSVPLIILSLFRERELTIQWSVEAVLVLMYLIVFGSALAFLVLYWLFRRIQVTKVLSVAFANPLVAAVFGWLWLGEVLSPWALTGGAGVLTGLWLILAAARGPHDAARGFPYHGAIRHAGGGALGKEIEMGVELAVQGAEPKGHVRGS